MEEIIKPLDSIEDQEKNVVVKQEIIEEVEMKIESTEDQVLSGVLNHPIKSETSEQSNVCTWEDDPVVKREIVWCDALSFDQDGYVKVKMEKDCLGDEESASDVGENTSDRNGAVLRTDLFSCTCGPVSNVDTNCRCLHKKTEAPDSNTFATQVCEKCGGLLCVCSVASLEQAGGTYSCTHCDYETKYAANYKRHAKIHKGKQDGPFSCTQCDYTTFRKIIIEEHQRKHSGEKPYSCSKCKFKTGISSHLKRHMKDHVGDEPFSCEFCGFQTADSLAMKEHLTNHKGETPYACDQCDFKTALVSGLKKHMRVHSGSGRYACNQCEFNTRRISKFRIHMNAHKGGRFSCPHCEYKTAYKFVLTKHIKVHHS